ncbi:T9SS type A sorting domain-containing protein [Dyadobacter jiangsuensis]
MTINQNLLMQSRVFLTRPPLYLFICFFAICQSILAQQRLESNRNINRTILAPSPTVGSIGTFGNTPVSHYTGTPDITIPLYEVSYKELSINLELKYHQSIGTKPDAFPGSTGNGWLLNTGGVITRISRGATSADMPSGYTYPVNFNPTADANWSSAATMNDHLKKQTVFVNEEARYDEYAYNFAGHSGKFYMDHTNALRIRTEQGEDIMVQRDTATSYNFTLPMETQTPTGCTNFVYSNILNQRRFPFRFTLTDSQGIKYTFGGTNESIEITRPGMGYGIFDVNNQNPTPTSWYLTKIESPNGYKIDLTYTRGKFYITNEKSVFGKNITPIKWADSGPNNAPFPPYIKSTMYHPCYLDEIVTPISKVKFNWSIANQQLGYNFTVDCMNNNINGDVHFYAYLNVKDASLNGRFPSKLDNFVVSNIVNSRIQKVEFAYTNSATSRLKLLSVKFQGLSDGWQNVPTYSFEYNPTPLPAYLSLKSDDYGFYNNNGTYTASTDPQYYYNLFTNATSRQNYLASRAPNATYAIAEVLQKVTYPTGGYTEYEYELNQYGRIAKFWPASIAENSNGAVNTGGLRIKRISNYDALNNKATERTYFYKLNYATGGTSSSGVLSFEPIHYASFSGLVTSPKHFASVAADSLNFTGNMTYVQYSTEPLNSVNFRGNHITYSEVAEVDMDGSYKVFKYKNYDNGFHDKPAERMVTDNSNVGEFWKEDEMNSLELERGQLTSEQLYTSSNGLKERSVYNYNDDVNRFNSNVRRIKLVPNPIFSANYMSIRYTANLVYTYYPFLKTKTTTTYEASDSIATPVTRTYHATNRLLTSETYTDSKGQSVVVAYKYPHDYTDATSTAMAGKHIISPVMETKTTVGGTQVNLVQTPYYSPSTNIYVPQEIKVQNGSGPLETRLQFTKYDSRGTLLEQQKPGDVKENFLWGYFSNFLMAKIIGSDYNTINSFNNQSFLDNAETSELAVNSTLTSIRNSLATSNPAAQMTSYARAQASIVGVRTVTDANGKIILYEYDNFGRLKSVNNAIESNMTGAVRASYCYNYRGQPADCATMAPTGSIAASTLTLLADAPLPVTLINFDAIKQENAVRLNWSTSFETNSERFEIEHSTDAKIWSKIGTVSALGESNAEHQYTFTDNNPAMGGQSNGENFYRLKMIDADATFTYSRIRSVIFGGNREITLYPNPVTISEKLNILADNISNMAGIKIFDSAGKLVLQTKAATQIDTRNLRPGLYVIIITYTDGSSSSHRVVKQ